tara:strand:+ start:676 stop:1713 length:1038 start_codon:yes stop_codon:yes gene_type:complete
MAKKWLYSFTINREIETEKKSKSTNDEGKEVEVIEKVKETTPVEFSIQKPYRKLYDDAELFYGVKMSEGIKAGLLTRNLLAKRYEDDGGAFSETEKQRYSELYLAIYNKEEEYQRLQLNLDNKPQELKDRLSQDLLFELADLRRELAEIENSQSNIFDQTAENRAKNQTIMWWVLKLSHWKEFDHKNHESFFPGENFDEKLEVYDSYEEEGDDFFGEAIRKLAYFVSFWYMGRATSEEEFKTVEELYNSQNQTEEEASEEETSEEDEANPTEEKAEEKKATPKKKTAAKKKRGRKPKASKAKETEEAKTESGEEAKAETVENATEEESVLEKVSAESKTNLQSEE